MWSRRDKKSAWNPGGYERVVADRGSWHYQRCRGTGTEEKFCKTFLLLVKLCNGIIS